MPQSKDATSWLDVVAGLLASKKRSTSPYRRRLVGERLERRTVLSTVQAVPTANSEGESLAQYVAREHPLGPIAPPASAAETTTGHATSDALTPATGAVSIDRYFGVYSAGEGEGEGGGSGSGSGAGSGSGSGSGVGSGSGAGSGVGSGSGSGSGAGSGSGSGSSSGSGGDGSPTISDVTTDDGGITYSGHIGDDGGLGSLDVDYDGPGTFSMNENGDFFLDLGSGGGTSSATITLTDADGHVTTYNFIL